MSEQYKGGVPLTGGLEVKGGGDDFPLVKAHDVYVDDNTRLDDKLNELAENSGGSGGSDINLENGEGKDSLVQKHTGEVTATTGPNQNTGESAVVFGSKNTNSAKYSLIVGSVNFISDGENNVVCGLGNTVSSVDSIVFGVNNTVTGDDSLTGGISNRNEKSGFVLGTGNHNQGIYSVLVGTGLINSGAYKVVCGRYNADTTNALFEVGNGVIGSSSNAFEVLSDGRARAGKAAQEPTDLVRKNEFDAAVSNLASKEELAGVSDRLLYEHHVRLNKLSGTFSDGTDTLEGYLQIYTTYISNSKDASFRELYTSLPNMSKGGFAASGYVQTTKANSATVTRYYIITNLYQRSAMGNLPDAIIANAIRLDERKIATFVLTEDAIQFSSSDIVVAV